MAVVAWRALDFRCGDHKGVLAKPLDQEKKVGPATEIVVVLSGEPI